MKIIRIEIRRLRLPLIRSFTTSRWTIDRKETVIVKLHSADGLIGYGESPALPIPAFNHETADTCMYALRMFIAPAVVGKKFESIEDFLAAYSIVQGNQTAKAGIECAFWHLMAQRDNRSLKSMFGGSKNEIPVGESIDIKPSIDDTLQEIEQCLTEGYRRIKVKIKPGWDVELLAAIRDVWPDINLTADANTGYRLSEHMELLRSLDKFNLTMLEQPFAARNFVDHAELQKSLSTPICLDESIESPEDVRTATALGACKIVNIKPMRVGGIFESLEVYDYAATHGIGVWCGGVIETGLGRAFNIALASKEKFIHPADMSPYKNFYTEDIVDPSFVVKPNGCIDVPDTPGLGYTVRDDQIEKFTVEKVIVAA